MVSEMDGSIPHHLLQLRTVGLCMQPCRMILQECREGEGMDATVTFSPMAHYIDT